jgi:hypothetical protein
MDSEEWRALADSCRGSVRDQGVEYEPMRPLEERVARGDAPIKQEYVMFNAA